MARKPAKKKPTKIPKDKPHTIVVYATFNVRFTKDLTAKQLADLESGKVLIDDVVDESEAYDALRDDGDCDLSWE